MAVAVLLLLMLLYGNLRELEPIQETTSSIYDSLLFFLLYLYSKEQWKRVGTSILEHYKEEE